MKNNNRLLYLITGILFLWCIVLSVSLNNMSKNEVSVDVNEYTVSGYSTDFTKVVSDTRSAVVSVSSGADISTGIVYKTDGSKAYIITSLPKKEDAASADVTFDSSYKTKGEIIGRDAYTDIAVVEIDTPYDLETIKIGNSSLTKTGESVLMFGSPVSLDYRGAVESGIISDDLVTVNREIETDSGEYGYYLNMLELSSSIKSGYSGSPVLNMSGEVIGICESGTEEIAFALPVNEAVLIADSIISGTGYHRNQLGIKGDFVSAMPTYYKTQLNISLETVSGYYVENLKDNGIAYLLGTKAGDVITSINGIEIDDFDDLLKAVYSDATDFVFTIMRGSEEITLSGSITAND